MTAYTPDWAAPASVSALITTRNGGVSAPPFGSFNLGAHVGDAPDAVAANRALLAARLGAMPVFLEQVHGATVLDLDSHFDASAVAPTADAVITSRRLTPCVVMVADCLPLLLASADGSVVGAVHCGWRGILGGAAAAAITAMRAKLAAPCEIVAYMGPAIGPAAFEVGAEVRELFMAQDRAHAAAFTLHTQTKNRTTYLANIYRLLIASIHKYAIANIAIDLRCTFTDTDQFFSYRRNGRTGRQAAVVWIN